SVGAFFFRLTCSGLLRLARRGGGITSLSGGIGGRRSTDDKIARPAVRMNLPHPRWLPHEDDQIFSALLAALAHCDWNEHLATAKIDGYLAHYIGTQRFHLHVTQTSLKQRK